MSFYKFVDTQRRQILFIVAAVASATLLVVAQIFDAVWLLSLLIIPYFIAHGYENEITLYKRVGGKKEVLPLLVLSLWLAGVTTYAFLHPSAYFTSDLSFLSGQILASHLVSIGPLLVILCTVIGLALMFGGVLHATFKIVHSKVGRPQFIFSCVLILVIIGLTVGTLVYGPYNYVYLFFWLLMYHFLTWGIHYGVLFANNKKRLGNYFLAHAVIILGTIGIYSVFKWLDIQNPNAFVFNGNVFLFLTTVHITTSFLNDDFVQKFFGLQRTIQSK